MTNSANSFSLVVYVVIGLTALLWLQRCVFSKAPRGSRTLPGPKGYPVIGNLLDFPPSHWWIKFQKWGEIYGPIYQIKIFGTTSVIINDAQVAEDLMATRGLLYSDRRLFPMVHLVTDGGDLVVRGSDDYWKRGRKFATIVTSASMANKWKPYQAREARRMVVDMIRDPSKYQLWLERVSTCVSVRQGFGKDLVGPEEGEYHTKKIMSRMHTLERVGSPGLYLVDFLPVLMYLPEWLAPFKRYAKKHHKVESSYFYGLFQEAEEKFKKGIPEDPPSFARQWLSKDDGYGLEWKEACYVIATLYGGGSGTTSLTMHNYCLAMCHYPEWQDRLHREVENVVGPDRIPDFSDWGELPLVRAVAKELLRWRPVVPSNVPHRVVKDDVYQGYHIPKGSMIWGNQWGIHRNDAMYPDGELFCPDRWLSPEYPTTYKQPGEQDPTIKRYSAFGFGRRICPGYEIAERALFIQIASLAWACRIHKKTVDGKEVEVPWYKYVSAGNSGPEPFEFDVEAYGKNRMTMMEEAWKASEV